MRRRVLQVLIGSALGLLAALALSPILAPAARPAPPAGSEFLLPTPLPAPAFALVGKGGAPVTEAALRGRFAVVVFGYTSCPDVCPLTMASLAGALDRLGGEAARVQGVLVTVDPARDTPDRLAEYLGRFDPGFLGLGGSDDQLRAAADAFGVFYEVAGGAAGAGGAAHAHGTPKPASADGGLAAGAATPGYLVDHTGRSYVLDPEGRIVMTFPPDADADDFARGLALLVAG